MTSGLTVANATANVDMPASLAAPREYGRPPFVEFDYARINIRRRVMKRTIDIVGSVIALIVTSPVMLAVAIAVKATSPGPILFRHERIGHKGEPFTMLKFRSMAVNADRIPVPSTNIGKSARDPYKTRNDPRLTKIGRFLRKYSLDEFPQFINVLRNEMSLVGPRPQVRREVDLYGNWDYRRLLVKPGITGLWQVSGRSDLNWEDGMRLDLDYVENWSITTDVVILSRTAKAVLYAHGAY